jgi:phosphoglycolate phosphatase-like HAD superfamily hydrolase
MAYERVYLFDIDGTLVDAQGMGGKAFRRAVREVLSHDLGWQGRDFAGQTDAGLFGRILDETGMHRGLLTDLYDRYHEYLAVNLSKQPARILPGVVELLEQLSAEKNTAFGLLTGNTRRGSLLKLGELSRFFDFGYYGDTITERTQLGVAARKELVTRFGAAVELVIVGDTPNDIACARAAGARCVAVATGLYRIDELAAADRVLADLTEW